MAKREDPATGAPGKRRVISLRWIISGAAVALTTSTVIGVGAMAERNARQALSRELQNRMLLEARNLALTSSGALLTDFPELTLTPILTEIQKNEPEVRFAVVVDLENRIRGHADARKISAEFEYPKDLRFSPSGDGLKPGERLSASDDILVASAPVNHPTGGRLGTAMIGVERAYIDAVVAESRKKMGILLAGFLAVGIVLAFGLMSTLLRPIGPLREGLERIGRGDLETPVRLKDRTELGLLAATMNDMSRSLADAQTERVEKERLAREVELASEIQSSLLPSESTEVDGFRIAGAHRAALEVGGDYYDVLPLADGRLGIAIADVSGKGLGGCLVMAMLSAVLRAFRDSETSPAALLAKLESQLVQSLRPGTFITMFYGVLDPLSGEMVFASAGHNPLLVRRSNGKTEWYETRGIPIGAVRGGALARTLHDDRVQLEPGDLCVQYTDGIHEAFDISGENQFGLERLDAAVAKAAGAGCDAVLETVRHDVETWVGDQDPLDDETILVIEVAPRSAPTVHEPAAPGAEAAGTDSPEPTTDEMLARLDEARTKGQCVPIPADLDRLHPLLRRWLKTDSALSALPKRVFHVLESALYEICANVAEHGYDNDAAQSFELRWLPAAPSDPAVSESPIPARGAFFLLDGGTPFRPKEGHDVDFADRSVRRRRRGIGLRIIQVAMQRVVFRPGTPVGNVTMLEFDPSKVQIPHEEEIPHG